MTITHYDDDDYYDDDDGDDDDEVQKPSGAGPSSTGEGAKLVYNKDKWAQDLTQDSGNGQRTSVWGTSPRSSHSPQTLPPF